jgi:hypothetical protein
LISFPRAVFAALVAFALAIAVAASYLAVPG